METTSFLGKTPYIPHAFSKKNLNMLTNKSNRTKKYDPGQVVFLITDI